MSDDVLAQALNAIVDMDSRLDDVYGDTEDLRRELAARNAQVIVWRPISEAPKDGTEIDLWLAHGERVPEAVWNSSKNRWEHWWIGDFGRMDMVDVPGTPTHFAIIEPPAS